MPDTPSYDSKQVCIDHSWIIGWEDRCLACYHSYKSDPLQSLIFSLRLTFFSDLKLIVMVLLITHREKEGAGV